MTSQRQMVQSTREELHRSRIQGVHTRVGSSFNMSFTDSLSGSSNSVSEHIVAEDVETETFGIEPYQFEPCRVVVDSNEIGQSSGDEDESDEGHLINPRLQNSDWYVVNLVAFLRTHDRDLNS